MWLATGELPEELASAPPFPPGLKYIWVWFSELQTNGDTILTYQEIDAWSRLTSQRPTPGEVKFLIETSRLYVRTVNSNE